MLFIQSTKHGPYLKIWFDLFSWLHLHVDGLIVTGCSLFENRPHSICNMYICTLYQVIYLLRNSTDFNPGPAEPGYTLPLQTVKIQFSWLLRGQLIWIYTVCLSVCKFIPTVWIKWFDWLKIWKGRGISIYSAGQEFRGHSTLGRYSAKIVSFLKDTTFMASCLLPWIQSAFKKGLL